MEDENVVGTNSDDDNDDAQMWVWEISDIQNVMINDHTNWNTHHDVSQTYNCQKDALHVEAHVAHACQEHQSDEIKVWISNINSFSFLPEPWKSDSF
jgi:uncharacterized protein YyaL (SSP411 family)